MIGVIRNKINNSREAKNAIWLIGGRIAQMLLSLIVNVLTAKYLGPSSYGLINYITAYVAFFTSFCTLGINAVIIRDFVEHPEEQGQTIGTTLVLRFISSLLSAIMIVCIVSIIDHNEPLTIVIAILCSVSLIFQVFDTFNYWFQSRYQSKVTSIATFVAYFATSIYRIILLITQKNVQWFAFATSIDYAVLGSILLYAYKKQRGPRLSFSPHKAKSLLSKSYHYILSGMMVAIYGQTDKLMLKQMLDDTTVGYYSLATSISTMWVFVLSAIIDSMYPTIVGVHDKDYELFKRKNRQLYAMVIYVSVAVSVLLTIFAPLVIGMFFGQSYLPATNPLRIITWYTVFSYLGVARNAWIVCENKQKYLKYMYVGAAIINVALNYIMIPIWGASGAALASLITQICTSLLLPCFWKDMRPNAGLMVDAFFLRKIK